MEKTITSIAKGVMIIILSLSLLCLSWGGAHIFLFDQFVIPSKSMTPVLMPGDRVIVNKTIMGARIYSNLNFKPEGGELKCWRTRGTRTIRINDIVVFNFPEHNRHISFILNEVYCKRCVALPGDSLSIVDGHYVNNNFNGELGNKQAQDIFANIPDSTLEYVFHTIPYDENIPWTIHQFGPLYIPRSGDIIRITPHEASLYRMLLEWETGKRIDFSRKENKVWANGKELKYHQFRHNYYFMAGDNVGDSNDSRYWGLVPEEYIVGVVKYISYSVDPETGKHRKGRTLKRV
ncbi:MAG: signal peptidase I [Prevotella sp.]|nr:signal peptidase I [Prevotella sp.]